MASLKAHFGGHSIVLDEPATLAVGPTVRVIVEPQSSIGRAELSAADFSELSRRTDEALEPVREAFAASGMTDDELAEFLEVETHAMRGISYQRD